MRILWRCGGFRWWWIDDDDDYDDNDDKEMNYDNDDDDDGVDDDDDDIDFDRFSNCCEELRPISIVMKIDFKK